MASLISLKRRIQAGKNISKTTKAFQMIAASKLKKAQDATLSTRPYVERLGEMTRKVTTQIGEKKVVHPYLQVNKNTEKTLLIVITPDKGLCGGLITNLLKEFFSYTQNQPNTSYIAIGKKIESKTAMLGNDVIASFHFGLSLPTFDMVYPIMRLINDQYTTGKVKEVKILTTHFTNVFTQKPQITTLLPFSLPESTQEKNDEFYLFEPNASKMLPALLQHYVEMTLYQQLLESFVSEQGARMMAMQNATDNANDIIGSLQLEYNKTRQAKITSEILDISSASMYTK